jgi:hypothetical protein
MAAACLDIIEKSWRGSVMRPYNPSGSFAHIFAGGYAAGYYSHKIEQYRPPMPSQVRRRRLNSATGRAFHGSAGA